MKWYLRTVIQVDEVNVALVLMNVSDVKCISVGYECYLLLCFVA